MKAITEKIIAAIPSEALKEHLKKNPPELSCMQWASIAAENMEGAELAGIFSALAKITDNADEQKLLLSAISDIGKKGYVWKRTFKLYEKMRKSQLSPYYPFLEICNLPVLFKQGDVISYSAGEGEYGYAFVEGMPEDIPLAAGDFSDECYYCHDLDCEDPEQALLDGSAHLHIHICEADSCNENDLSAKQRKNLQIMREKASAHTAKL